MDLIPIRYIGNKTVFRDHLFGSGLSWKQGAVEKAPADVAVRLLEFPTFEDARKNKTPIVVDEMPPEEPDVLDEAPLFNLEAMTKAQLADFAHRQFGVRLATNQRKEDMMDTVRRQMGKRVA